MGELIEKENIMQNFDTIDKDIFEKKTDTASTNAMANNPYFQMNQYNQYTKTIRLGTEIDKIWNSKHNPDFINKIFMWSLGQRKCHQN